MPYGIRIKDGGGAVSVEYTDRITRVLGSASTGTSDSSIFVDTTANGIPFFAVAGSVSLETQSTYTPSIQLSGNLISWTFPPFSSVANRQPVTIVYGVYS